MEKQTSETLAPLTCSFNRRTLLTRVAPAGLALALLGGVRPIASANTIPHTRSLFLLNGTPIKQKYPLDCEAAALSMALDIQGTKVDEDTLLNDIGADRRPAAMKPDGTVKQWGNPYKTFVGDVHAPSEKSGRGYGVYSPPIARTAQKHGHLAVSRKNVDPQVLYRELASGNPSVVWIPFGLHPKPLLHWTSWDGQSIPYNFSEHAVTLIGIDTSTDKVALLDPYYGNERWYPRAQFEAAFRSFGRMAVTVL
jgi:uncharacterized protein YvpB